MTSDTLHTPEDFAAEGLTPLWAVLETFCADGWDYEVRLYGTNAIEINLKTHDDRADALDIGRLLRALLACSNEATHRTFIEAHDGGGEHGTWGYTFSANRL